MFDFSVLNEGIAQRRVRGKDEAIVDGEGRIPLFILGTGSPPSLPEPLTSQSIKKMQESYGSDLVIGYLVVK